MAEDELRIENAAKQGKNKSTCAKYKTLHNIVDRILSEHNTQWNKFSNHSIFLQAMALKKEGKSGETLIHNMNCLIARHQSLHHGHSPTVMFYQAVAALKVSYIRTGYLDPTQM